MWWTGSPLNHLEWSEGFATQRAWKYCLLHRTLELNQEGWRESSVGRLTCRRGSFIFLLVPRGGPRCSADDCPWCLTWPQSVLSVSGKLGGLHSDIWVPVLC